MRDFCPLCLRGGVPEHGASLKVVDPEQAETSRLLRGLPLLNLAAAGTPCASPCRMTCLVCGHAAVFGCETEFKDVIDAIEQHESDVLEARVEVLEGLRGFSFLGKTLMADVERRFRRKLARQWGLAWHPRWQRVTHLRCLKRAKCGCDLAFCATACQLHGEQRVLSRAPPARPAPQSTMDAAPEFELAKFQADHRAVPAEATAKKATWLTKPSALATTASKTVPETPAFAATSKRPKPNPVKTNGRLQTAAVGCDRLDSWVGKRASTNKNEAFAIIPAFSRIKHFRDFDPFQHGYWRVNNVDVYRFPDGRQVPVSATMHVLTDNGELEPSC
jgi:hypothetical protein